MNVGDLFVLFLVRDLFVEVGELLLWGGLVLLILAAGFLFVAFVAVVAFGVLVSVVAIVAIGLGLVDEVEQ